jgi:flavin-dependent dehydrogenase
LGSVAIIGAGPAGCAAALTLRRYVPELAVTLIDTQAAVSVRPAIGETLSPGVLPLLKYLGIDKDFLRAGHLPAGGTASAWGSAQVFERDYVFTARGVGWHLDRRRFDGWLLNHAEAAGLKCIHASAKRVARSEGRWSIELDGSQTISAEAIVDATGRTAWLARHLGSLPRRDDKLVAEVRWYLHDQPEQCAAGALVEATPDGWWYSAILPEKRAVAMFMTDADLRNNDLRNEDLQNRDLQNKTNWQERLAVAPATTARLEAWRETGETAMRAANSQLSPVVVGDGWVSAGDAAAAFDPISSLGIGFALRSGMEAARVASAAAEQCSDPALGYKDSITKIYADYRQRLGRIYQKEPRWPRAVFWARRRGPAPSAAL